MTSTKHYFETVEIPYGKKSVTEICKFCGARRKRYRQGNYLYYTDTGGLEARTTPCIEHEHMPKPRGKFFTVHDSPEPYQIISRGQREITVPATIVPDGQELHITDLVQVAFPGTIPALKPMAQIPSMREELEARFRELLVMLQLTYEDLVVNNINSQSRRMAGRFLYSQGYSELVGYLDAKAAI